MRGKVGQSYHTAPDNNANKGYLWAHSWIKHQQVVSYELSRSTSPWNSEISGKVCHEEQQSHRSRERSSWTWLTMTITGAISLHRWLRKGEENAPSPPRSRAEPNVLEVAGAGMATKSRQHGHWLWNGAAGKCTAVNSWGHQFKGRQPRGVRHTRFSCNIFKINFPNQKKTKQTEKKAVGRWGKQYVNVTLKLPLIASVLSHNISTFMSDLDCLASCSHIRWSLFAKPSI